MESFVKPAGTRGSLAGKISLAMSCLAVGAVLTVSSLSLLRERNSFHTELERQAELILDALAAATSNALYFNQFEIASEIIHNLDPSFQDEQFLVRVQLYQTDGRVIAEAFTEEPLTFHLEPDRLGQRILVSEQSVLEWHPNTLTMGKPIWVGETIVGGLSLTLSTGPLQAKLRKTLIQGLVVVLIMILSSIYLARLLSRSITQPLQKLIMGTQRITEGQWQYRITLHTNDELKTLADAFNQMGERLHTLFESLESQADALKQSRTLAHIRADKLEKTLQELHQTQAQLIHQAKMAGLGQMVAGIAHEINNPVNFIQGNIEPAQSYIESLLALIELYQKHLPQPPPEIVAEQNAIDLPFLKQDIAKLLMSMQVGAERITEIVKSLRTFSRLDEAICKTVNLHDCLDSTLLILEHRLKAHGRHPEIKVVKDYGELPLVECFASQLNQVLMNLLANAIDALEAKATKAASTAPEQTLLQICISTAVSAKNQVSIQIQDNAGGIPDTLQSRIFEPFYTTKPVGKGTGLGLSISHQIVTELHKGHISCQSIPGESTCFIVKIPSQQQQDSDSCC